METRTDSDDATKSWLIIQRPRSPPSGRTAKGQRKRQLGGCQLGAVAAAVAAAAAADDDDDDDDARRSGPSGEKAKGEKREAAR
ncbi:hypothetical protein PAAG_12513 [Paracoccidioides lutzii Pb01]|uniref:Uncharacterized protein n=1 Tax=Paracoccidioides lutzii (strain ATCC MYA-826 / Pb01) TaxID=502779 RepID=A0A0A2UZZ5_PARBA|nr:hypothetical protein PAAG_12513 [Paracoccidioides lutzii Pb01]KGQ00818.1 hypothetical protein PAAG_12513 [Paracoccidioides lutzii Pb01]